MGVNRSKRIKEKKNRKEVFVDRNTKESIEKPGSGELRVSLAVYS